MHSNIAILDCIELITGLNNQNNLCLSGESQDLYLDVRCFSVTGVSDYFREGGKNHTK